MHVTTFLFGAGAEQPYNICTGKDFCEELLLEKCHEERVAILGDDMARFQLISSNSRKVFIHSIYANESEARSVFKDKYIELCVEYYQQQPSARSTTPLEDFCRDCYHIVSNGTNIKESYSDSEKEAIKRFFYKHAVFFDSLDEKFNDLRNCPLGANGKRVLNAYYTIYIFMLKKVYNIPPSFTWSYKNIFDLLSQTYNNPELIGKTEETYYEVLGTSNLGGKDVHIATSNYTDLSKNVIKQDVSYLHGKLTWFEDYKHLKFYDVSNRAELPTDTKHLLPFIMIPSGVKPIISRKQLDEYTKFIRGLNESDVLCVVGYRFNSEDNHINAIIADWLSHDNVRKLIYFNYSSSKNFLDWNSLHWTEYISKKIIPLSKKINYDELLSCCEQIIDIQVEKGNSISYFKSLVKTLENRKT